MGDLLDWVLGDGAATATAADHDDADSPHRSSAPTAADGVRIETVPVNRVFDLDRQRFNTNNVWTHRVLTTGSDGDANDQVGRPRFVLETLSDGARVIPDDYEGSMAQCGTHVWVDHFRSSYRVVNVPRKHIGWMQQASRLAVQRAGLSPMYAEDILDAVADTDTGGCFDRCDRENPSTGYFVRTDRVSLKNGVHGVGPYFDLKGIIESSITASTGHQAVDATTTRLKYYLFPWRRDLHESREFRVFVCDGRVTAMSQQNLYKAHPYASSPSLPAIVRNWCRILLPYIEATVIPFFDAQGMPSFTLDVALLNEAPPGSPEARDDDREWATANLKPFFIEVNPFGVQYPAGAALFSWVHDFEDLYGVRQRAAVDDEEDGAGRARSSAGGIPVRLTAGVQDPTANEKVAGCDRWGPLPPAP